MHLQLNKKHIQIFIKKITKVYMTILTNQEFKISDFTLEVLNVEGKILRDYPDVVSGYVFHFTLGANKIGYEDIQLFIEYDWKHTITGSLESLTAKLENFKEQLLSVHPDVYETIDQFGNITLCIMDQDNTHQLLISSDTFDVSKIIDLAI